MFDILQENWTSYSDPFVRAALFLMLSWSSSTGLISSGNFQKAPYNPLLLSNIENFRTKNFHLTFVDPKLSIAETIASYNSAPYLMLPMGRFSYNLFEEGRSLGKEQTAVNHRDVFSALDENKQKWIVLYKNHNWVYKTYRDYDVVMVDKYGNTTQQKNDCEDIIVTNF